MGKNHYMGFDMRNGGEVTLWGAALVVILSEAKDLSFDVAVQLSFCATVWPGASAPGHTSVNGVVVLLSPDSRLQTPDYFTSTSFLSCMISPAM
jgi:hypothetical protein